MTQGGVYLTILNRMISGLNRLKKIKKEIIFNEHFKQYKKLDQSMRFLYEKKDIFPCLEDNTGITNFDAHYIYHPAWAARVIHKINPKKHIDISSLLSFSTVLSAYVPTEFYDYRPALLNLEGLKSGESDLTNLLFPDNSIESISCMHTIEHIGLGRYGDPIDPEGDIKAINELKRVVKKDGNLLLVVPMGKPRLQFNAHRIYSYKMIANQFDDFEIKDFSLITDKNEFISPAIPELVENQNYGCGCFWFIKK
jgi:SAM-dependent methyltransferase